jgi:hypothetical protein
MSALSSHKALHHWHTAKHVLSPAQIKARQISAVGTVAEHGHSFLLHDGMNWQLDGLKCAEENQSKLSVPASVEETARGSHCAVEQLGPFYVTRYVSCYITLYIICYITHLCNMLYHIFLIYNTLYCDVL